MTHPSVLLFELVRQVLGQHVDVPEQDIRPDSDLKALGIDSLTLAELLFELEDRLGTALPDATELPQTVQDVVRLIQSHVDVQALRPAA